jgi:hypothetical protein
MIILLLRHIEETFRPYNAHEIAAKEFSDVQWDKHLHEPYSKTRKL